MLTVKETADYLKMDIETIRRYIYRKSLKAYKVGKEWRIKETDLQEFIERESNMDKEV